MRTGNIDGNLEFGVKVSGGEVASGKVYLISWSDRLAREPSYSVSKTR